MSTQCFSEPVGVETSKSKIVLLAIMGVASQTLEFCTFEESAHAENLAPPFNALTSFDIITLESKYLNEKHFQNAKYLSVRY